MVPCVANRSKYLAMSTQLLSEFRVPRKSGEAVAISPSVSFELIRVKSYLQFSFKVFNVVQAFIVL